MDYSLIKGYRNDSLEHFLEQWSGGEDYITAHTSGSTGSPKEIRLLKSDMINSALATCRFFDIGKGSRMVNPLSVDYIAGKMMVVRALVSDSELWIEKPSMTPLKDWESGDLIDLLPVVPAQIPGLMASGRMRCVKNIIIGGSKLDRSIEESLVENGVSAYCTYGMTETCSHVAMRKIGQEVYSAMPGFRFSKDERGCLVIESSSMSFGRLVTNDVVDLESATSFRWVGRFDNVINSGGIKFFPEQIEAKIADLIIGRDFYISSRPSATWGNELILLIEGSKPINGLSENLSDRLTRYERPKAIIYKEHFMRTSSGKIIRD